MKKFKDIAVILSLAVALLSGCIKETLLDNADAGKNTPKGLVRLKINTGGGEFQTPSTRATALESDIDNVWVLVFKGSDYNTATFVEAAKSTIYEGARVVSLTEAAGDHKLLVVANADLYLQEIKNNSSLTGKTLTAAISTLQYGNPYNTIPGNGTLASQQVVMPFAEPAMSMPMSEVLSVSSISATTEVNATGAAGGSALQLRRITAKVVVDGSAVFNKFVITQVAAFQGARSAGSLVPGEGGAIQSGGTFVSYYKGDATDPTAICTTGISATDASQNNTESYPAYIYESTGTPSFIIISAIYNGSTYYYKLRLKKADGTDYTIKRNYHYTFKINTVTDGVLGYLTLKDAIGGAQSSNITGQVIEIKDGTSTDMIDNGTYYLGTDCSEVVIYSSFAENASTMGTLPLVTITTNATAAMIGGTNNSIAVSNPDIAAILSISNDGSNNGHVNLSTDGTTPRVTKISLSSLPLAFTTTSTSTINITLGNLTKTIKVTRKPLLSYGGFDAVAGNFTAGVIDPASTLPGFALSTDGIKTNAVSQFAAPTSAGASVSLCADNGKIVLASPAIADTKAWGVAYLSHAEMASNGLNRTKCMVRQDYKLIEPVDKMYLNGAANTTAGYWSYVGAFWKNNEVGERLIAMQNTSNSSWSAVVYSGVDWIELDTNYPTSLPNDDHPSQTVRIGGGLTKVLGTGTEIKFRIGLKSTYTATTTAPVRYGVIIVFYDDQGVTKKAHPIFIRQGESPDVKKLSPYNLTSATLNGEVALRGGVFTDFPTQAGAMWQWNSLYAWSPITILSSYTTKYNTELSWNSSYEPCPVGYKTPNASSISYYPNEIWGYYADGYFDRRTIQTSVLSRPDYSTSPTTKTVNSVVYTGTSEKVAYFGCVMFSSAGASTFYPAVGARESAGNLCNIGTMARYWSNAPTIPTLASSYLFSKLRSGGFSNDRSFGFSLRCIAE